MANLFTLEALNAAQGDCLLLHYGTAEKPRQLLIDGGPSTIYARYLKRRLQQIVEKTSPTKRHVLRHVMLTHIDDDHIRGLLDFAKDIKADSAPSAANQFWVNVFEDLAQELPPQLANWHRIQETASASHPTEAVLSSVGQGRSLRDAIRAIGATINRANMPLLLADDAPVELVKEDGITITLIAPSKQRVKALFDDWQRKTAAAKNKAAEEAALAEFTDKSVYNLSSLVLIVETTTDVKKLSMLLTGDARGDDIIFALDMAGRLRNGKAHFDILKMPHHGSDRNMTLDFLKNITADHYVISADGRHGNPDAKTLDWIVKARGNAAIKVYLTNAKNEEFPELEETLKRFKRHLGAEKVLIRGPKDLSISVHLGAPLPY